MKGHSVDTAPSNRPYNESTRFNLSGLLRFQQPNRSIYYMYVVKFQQKVAPNNVPKDYLRSSIFLVSVYVPAWSR
jgi:hypothetical protein